MNEIIESYATLGALGVSFCILMLIVWKWVNNVTPALEEITKALINLQQENINHKLILDNNTKALETVARSVEEVARSNNNVANMVQLLNATMENQISTLDRHDKASVDKFNELTAVLREHHEEEKGIHEDVRSDLRSHDLRGERVELGLGKLKGAVEKQTYELKAYINEK